MNNNLGTTFCGIKIVISDFTMAKFCDNMELKKWINLIQCNDFIDYKQGGNIAMDKFVDKVISMNNDSNWLDQLHNDLVAFEERSSYYNGIKKGIEQGIKQGIEINTKKTILNLYNAGFNINDISKYLNLSTNEIKNYLN